MVSVYSYKCWPWCWVRADGAREKKNKTGRRACVLRGLSLGHCFNYVKSRLSLYEEVCDRGCTVPWTVCQ